MDELTRLKICRLIAGLVVADEDFDEREEAFIDKMLLRFGLAQEDRDSLYPITEANEAAEELASLPAEVQQQAFALLIDAAAADKRYTSEEEDYLRTVARVLSIPEEKLQEQLRAALVG